MGYTIKDIARELGISATTVSLIINNRPCRVSESRRKAVEELVQKYHYQPNSSARALVTKKTNTIGLIVPDISNPFFSELAKGIEREAQNMSYSVIFCDSDNKGSNDVKNASLLMNKQVDGIILAPSLSDEDDEAVNQFSRLITENKVPIVLTDRKIIGYNYDIVYMDHHEGGFLATKHLLELGHREIGCITGPLSLESARERYNGYVAALKLYDIAPRESWVAYGDYQMASGSSGAQKLIEQGVTAIFACNDMMACGAMRRAMGMGLKIGQELSLIGFDNIPLCEFLEQPLTTINQPTYEMGKSAFQLLMELMGSPRNRKQNILFLPELVERNTTSALSKC